MNDTRLKILDRQEKGSSGAKRTRSEGFVPGVLYGKDNQGQPVKVEASAIRRIISRMGSSAIFDAEYNGKPRLIMLKEVQSEPVGGNVLHVDLFEISADETVTTTVPLVAVGAEGITGGGVLQQMMNEVQVSCLPRAVPKAIEFDVSGMHPGQALYVSDLKVGDEIEILTPPDEMVANIIEPRTGVEEAEETEEAEKAGEAETTAEE
jgi:large subunit ribosomal protein L25